MAFLNIGKWYWNMTLGQRWLCWIVAVASIICFGIGLLLCVILLYCHLGKSRYI